MRTAPACRRERFPFLRPLVNAAGASQLCPARGSAAGLRGQADGGGRPRRREEPDRGRILLALGLRWAAGRRLVDRCRRAHITRAHARPLAVETCADLACGVRFAQPSAMAGYSSYGRMLTGQPDPHGEGYGAGGKVPGYFPRDPYAETWSVPASKNRGLAVPPGMRNEIGQVTSPAVLRVDRQLHLDTKAYFRWTRWKATQFGIWGVLVPVGIYMAIANEMVSSTRISPDRLHPRISW